MNSRILTAILAAALALPIATALAGTDPKAPADKPLTRAQSIEARATVTAVDPKTRIVTLKTEDGETFDVEAGPPVKNWSAA